MAFNKLVLQNDVKAVFDSMTDGDDWVFANGIANAVVAFVGTGVVSTSDAGGVTAGAFTGSGKGSLSVSPTLCAKIIKDACDYMKNLESGGNDYLSEQIGAGIQRMADDGVVTTTVTGEVVTPSGSTISPYGGTAKGDITCVSSPLISALKAVFAQMWDNRSVAGYDGNLELAKEFADKVDAFWKNGVISTSGQGNIAGSVGSGSIS